MGNQHIKTPKFINPKICQKQQNTSAQSRAASKNQKSIIAMAEIMKDPPTKRRKSKKERVISFLFCCEQNMEWMGGGGADGVITNLWKRIWEEKKNLKTGEEGLGEE